jgi:hypothetical protein
MKSGPAVLAVVLFLMAPPSAASVASASVPPSQRGTITAERLGTHDAGNIRTLFWNYGMVGDYPQDPLNVDLSVFHSLEAPKGSGMNYGEGLTPFVLAKIRQNNGSDAYIMETGFRERQGISPLTNRVMRFEPRPGYFQPNPSVNLARSPAISNDPRTWPNSWPDKLDDPNDPGWPGSWNGYFGKHPAADQESYTVMDDDFYDAWDFYPDVTDPTRRGLGLRIQVRGLQWADPRAGNVAFWIYDITNEGTTDYDDNIIFGLYADPGVGGSQLSCDGVFESDDDDVYLDRSTTSTGAPLDVVYTRDSFGHGVDLSGSCSATGYLGYVYLETPGSPFDAIDNDGDGITDERRDGGPGFLIQGQQNIRDFVTAAYDLTRFARAYGPLEERPAYMSGRWWTGDEDMDWDFQVDDVGADGVAGTLDSGEGDGIPTQGEPHFDRTDLHESDQVGLTGFKINRIHPGPGNPDPTVDNIVFYTDQNSWPQRLYNKFTDPYEPARFDPPLTSNYNLGFLLASGPLRLGAGKTERMSVALAYGADLDQVHSTVVTAQQIYNANYQFTPDATPALASLIHVDASPERVLLHWRLGESGMARLERSAARSSWLEVGQARSDGTGDVTFEDRDIEAGAHYSYRLSVWSGSQWTLADAVPVDVPMGVALSLAGLRPNPATGRELTIHFSLESTAPASLEMLDLAGRVVRSREVGSLGPGRHMVRLGDGAPIRPGIYLLRLVQGEKIRTARAVVLE